MLVLPAVVQNIFKQEFKISWIKLARLQKFYEQLPVLVTLQKVARFWLIYLR